MDVSGTPPSSLNDTSEKEKVSLLSVTGDDQSVPHTDKPKLFPPAEAV